MISNEILESFRDEMSVGIKSAIIFLANSGVLQAQLDANFASVQHGSTDESAKELAERIIRWRINNGPLIELIELGKRLSEERDDG